MRQRPMSTLIFGILNIGYALMQLSGPLMAGLGAVSASFAKIASNPMMDSMKSDPKFAALYHSALVASTIFGTALLAFGIGLLLLKNWARLGSIIFSVISIVYTPVASLLMSPYTRRIFEQTPHMPPGMAGAIASVTLVFSLLIGMGYPALLIFFMTRPNVIEACQPEQAPPAC